MSCLGPFCTLTSANATTLLNLLLALNATSEQLDQLIEVLRAVEAVLVSAVPAVVSLSTQVGGLRGAIKDVDATAAAYRPTIEALTECVVFVRHQYLVILVCTCTFIVCTAALILLFSALYKLFIHSG